jgi:hypothetical protein
MPARDALHYQMMFQDDLAPGGVLGAMLDGFERSQRGMLMSSGKESPIEAVPNPIGMFAPTVRYNESGDGLRQYFDQHMKLALAFYVDPKMTTLVTAAAESMPPDEGLRPEDLPSTHGFLLLPQGIAEVDLRGQLMVHNAVIWFQRAGGIDLWFLSSKYEDRDMVNLRHRRMFGEAAMRDYPVLTAAVYSRIEFGAGVPLSMGSSKVLPPEVVDNLRVIQDPESGGYAYQWNVGYDMDEWLSSALELRPNGPVAWIFACWRLMQQTIVDVRTEEVDRALRKAARKRKMSRDKVSVITLRKRKRVDGEGDSEIEWSHRHLRRGHWRQTWCGPRDGEIGKDRYQRAVWIHPTIVLAERTDLPLLERDHVYNLAR